MLKELVEHLEKRPAPVFENYGGRRYSDKPLFAVDEPTPDTINTTTLESVADYINDMVDNKTAFPLGRIIVHIVSPTTVEVLSECADDGKRYHRIAAKAVIPDIPFGRFLDCEMFNITMQTAFVENEARAELLKIVGNIYVDSTVTTSDDGMAQNVTLRAGIQRLASAKVANPFVLAPYRTFPEVEQPESPFVFRLQSGRGESAPMAALFEADGAAWRLNAIKNIREYFGCVLGEDKLKSGDIVILA